MRGGRPVVGFSLGTPTTFVQASADLQGQVAATIAAGDVHYDADVAGFLLDYTDATQSYQAAGRSGVNVVAPEIDSAGAPSVTKPLTQKAWTLNAQLQAIPKSGAPGGGMPIAYFTKTDADKAKVLVTAMSTLYSAAIAQGMANVPPGETTTPPAQAAATVEAPSVWPVLALGAVVAAVATMAITRTIPRRRRRSWSTSTSL